MSTIIRLNDVNFNNPDLPVIPQLVRGQIKFSYKPSTSNGFIDSSGAGDSPTEVGSPILTSTGVTVGNENGYRSAYTDTTDEFTAIAVVSPLSSSDTIVMGCFDDDNNTGWALFYTSSNIFASAHNGGGVNKTIGTGAPIAEDSQWIAMRVSGNELSIFSAVDGVVTKTSTTNDGFIDRAKNTSHNIGVGAASYSGWTAGLLTSISESTFYQRALTDAEMQKAYDYSSAYFNNHTDISI